MGLTPKQERDILRAFAKEFLRNKGINRFDHSGVRRDVGNLAKTSGFSKDEVYSVLQPITQELFDETFPSPALFPFVKESEGDTPAADGGTS